MIILMGRPDAVAPNEIVDLIIKYRSNFKDDQTWTRKSCYWYRSVVHFSKYFINTDGIW